MTSPAVKAKLGFQWVESAVFPSGWPWAVTPLRYGAGISVVGPGNELSVMPSGPKIRCWKTSAIGCPVTFSITMPRSR